MGWCGADLAEKVWKQVRKYIPEDDKEQVARKIFDMFTDYDADDWDINSKLIVEGNIAEREGWDKEDNLDLVEEGDE